MSYTDGFPAQRLPFKSKGKKWREACVDWAAKRTYFNYSPVRKSVVRMKINYDLLNGIIHMQDIVAILNPDDLTSTFVPEKIQHYPIINSKINTLRGEEAARPFDWQVVVTNPYSISQVEEEKKAAFSQIVQNVVETPGMTDEEAAQALEDEQRQFNLTWQDIRAVRATEVLNHYSKEQNFRQTFNDGFVDATLGREAYICSIVGGEPTLEKLNPIKLRYRNGYSNRIEDSDIIIYEDYWTRGRIIDTYYDKLSAEQVRRISDDRPENGAQSPIGAAGNVDESYGFLNPNVVMDEEGVLIEHNADAGFMLDGLPYMDGGLGSNLLPYDVVGNIRVLRVWWKSLRKILMVTSYDPETGEELRDFYPETYIPDTNAGEKATPLWVNDMWEGTKIGEDIYVNIRPCVVQYNRLACPSRCHAGIIGTIYNVNEAQPYSLVDMMKPYNYLYDAVHAKLVDLIATNWGKLLELDLALKPKDWKVEKWLFFARANKTLIKDSFNEGQKGAATGKLAGGLNNASKGVIDADWGQSIQNYIELLQWAKDSMSDLVGINRQREGQTYSRETVGGIERAVLQSSYITDWLFMKHEDTKRRVLECFLETAKAAFRGRNVKFQYILSDNSIKLVEFDGDEFAEADYGILVDNSADTEKLSNRLEELITPGLQGGTLDFKDVVRLYSTKSISERTRYIEFAQLRREQQARQAQQQQAQLEQQRIDADMQIAQQKLEAQDILNKRDNETKLKQAEINAHAEYLRLGIYENQNNEEILKEDQAIERDKLKEQIREFDKELRQKDKELSQKKEIELKKIAAQKASANKKSNSK